MNGQNGLACITPVSEVAKGNKLEVALPGLPVIKDLIVDMKPFTINTKRLSPFLIMMMR